jgi:heme/copper-type cytochrome/quinol oxidase subunit 4
MVGLLDILLGLTVITLSVMYFMKVRADKEKKHTIVLLLLSIFFYAPVVLALIYFLVIAFVGMDKVN